MHENIWQGARGRGPVKTSVVNVSQSVNQSVRQTVGYTDWLNDWLTDNWLDSSAHTPFTCVDGDGGCCGGGCVGDVGPTNTGYPAAVV